MTLWLPESARPLWTCTICGDPVYEGDEGHFAKCADSHREEIEADKLESKVPEVFDHGPERSDVELIEWVGKHREEIVEGRKRVN